VLGKDMNWSVLYQRAVHWTRISLFTDVGLLYTSSQIALAIWKLTLEEMQLNIHRQVNDALGDGWLTVD
jgi:hypothetical protein